MDQSSNLIAERGYWRAQSNQEAGFGLDVVEGTQHAGLTGVMAVAPPILRAIERVLTHAFVERLH